MEKIGFDGKDSIVLRTGAAERIERHRITRRNALIGAACAGCAGIWWMLDRLASGFVGAMGATAWHRINSPSPTPIRGVSQSDGIVEGRAGPPTVELKADFRATGFGESRPAVIERDNPTTPA